MSTLSPEPSPSAWGVLSATSVAAFDDKPARCGPPHARHGYEVARSACQPSSLALARDSEEAPVSITHQWMASWGEDRPALTHRGQTTTYGALGRRVRRGATWLIAQGLSAGDTLALQLPKEPVFLELCLASWALGITVLPLNDRYTADETRFAVTDAGARLAILGRPVDGVPGTLLDDVRLDDLPEHPLTEVPALDALGAILFTSGTTGRPKGARLTQRNLAAPVDALHTAWRWSAEDVLVHALPLSHVHGLFVAACGALRAGAHQIWCSKFDPREVLDALRQATVFMGVPTFYGRLLEVDEPPDLSGVRLFTSGSAPLAGHVHRAFQRRFGHAIVERYGMTEVGIVVSNPIGGERPGAVGLPLPGVSVRVVGPDGTDRAVGEIGEVLIRGPSVFAGYHDRPDATAAALRDGWMHTGDHGHIDPDGYLVLVGRRSDLVLVGGLNVYPGEVEQVLADIPGVREVAVFGIADPDLGEVPHAAFVGESSPDVVRVAARARLAPYKVPRQFHRLDALPRNAMGKVQKDALRRRLAPVVVRPARAEEAPEIARRNLEMALETEALVLDPERAARGAAAVFERDLGAGYLIAEVDGQPVGQLMLTREWSDWRDRWTLWIQSVYVAPDWRRRGVYRALHAAVLSRARAEGAAGVRLYVDRRNAGAMSVYRDVGMDGDHYALFEQMLDYTPASRDR